MAAGVNGTFRLKPEIRLIPRGSEGIVVRGRPLRAFRVNSGALAVLEKCRTGLALDDADGSGAWGCSHSVLPLLDRLFEAGILDWTPAPYQLHPLVSVIVPVYNRAGEIEDCLASLSALEYPKDRLEVIVVDDGSTDDTVEVAARYDVKLVKLPCNRGQSAARNEGVARAAGEIVAFIDSDCIAEPGWLGELVPYFQDTRTVLVGGYVASFYHETPLDRYEEAKSPLCMGRDLVVGSGSDSDFYVPTCNMLVRKDAYLQVGGLDVNQRVGEDVDLCWKLKEAGHRLMYVPKGPVKHKHRNSFIATFSRRFEYGTSEPLLHQNHRRVVKRYPWNPASMGILLGCLVAVGTLNPLAMLTAPALIFADSLVKKRRYQKQIGISLSVRDVLASTASTHFQLLYHLTYHVVRYYLLVLLAAALLFPFLAPMVAALVLFPSAAEFLRLRPRLAYPVFLFFFMMDHGSYQAGVFRGCIGLRSFRSYRVEFMNPSRAHRSGSSRPQEKRVGGARPRPLVGR